MTSTAAGTGERALEIGIGAVAGSGLQVAQDGEHPAVVGV
jgi:hypothetical protein